MTLFDVTQQYLAKMKKSSVDKVKFYVEAVQLLLFVKISSMDHRHLFLFFSLTENQTYKTQ